MRGRLLRSFATWFDNAAAPASGADRAEKRVDAARLVPFLVLHGGCLALPWVGWSPVAVATAFALYALRAFFVTGFYHRYFSHKTYDTSRAAQLVFAVLGNTAAQRGALWWAAHHRRHHATSDRAGDPHSPHEHGLYWSHMGWITSRRNFETDLRLIPDLARYPELRWLDRFDTLVPILLAAALFAAGAVLQSVAPALGTNGPQMLVWGFFVSTTFLFHVTCLVNSAAHLVGRRRFDTGDESRNSLWVALLTLGEGWHNNHHHYPAATRNGFYWWEIDVTYYGLRAMAWIGLIRNLTPVPERVLRDRRKRVPSAA
jgi:stearoyl-CoA desaturase (delta-9 desaturase)